MIEFTLWNNDGRAASRRISVDPAQILYFSAIQKRRAWEFWQDCTKISLTSGETFVVTDCYDAVKTRITKAGFLPFAEPFAESSHE